MSTAVAPPRTAALVVGGPHSFVQGTFAPHLNRLGIEVIDHWPYKENRDRPAVPAGTSVVLILKDMLAHSLSDKARALAKDAGVPFVLVPRKFAKAYASLERLGLIPEDYSAPTDEEQIASISEYLIEATLGGKASPSRGQIRGFVQQTYGFGATVTKEVIRAARQRAAARLEEIEKNTLSKKKESDAMNQDIHEAAALVFEDRIEATDQEAVKMIRSLLPNMMIAQQDALAAAQKARQATLAKYRKSYGLMTEAEQQEYMAKRDAWLLRVIKSLTLQRMAREGIQKPESATPTYRFLAEESRRLWGAAIDNTKIRDIRIKALNEIKAEMAKQVKVPPPPPIKKATPPIKKVAPPPVRSQTDSPYNRWGYSTSGMHDRIRLAHKAVKGLDRSTLMDLGRFLHAAQATSDDVPTMTDGVRKFIRTFRGNQLAFGAVLVFASPTIDNATATRLYKALFRKGLGAYVVPAVLHGMKEMQIDPKEFAPAETAPAETAPAEEPTDMVLASNVEEAISAAMKPFLARLDALAHVSPVEVAAQMTALSGKVDEMMRGIASLSTRMGAELTATQAQVSALQQEVEALRARADEKPIQEMTLRDFLNAGIGFELKPPAPQPVETTALTMADNGIGN